MDRPGDLPTAEIAKEPEESAQQPLTQVMMTPPSEGRPTGTQISEISSSSQCHSSYKDILSQPGPEMTQKQRLLWLQKRHKTGLWVQCDECDRWRFLAHVLDSTELPHKWYCKMNPDRAAADCSVPEKPIRLRDEEDLIHSEYSAGSVVLARLPGWPWWPAMVEDCPDTEQFYWLDGFSDIPTYFNVVFFDSHEATRSWITPQNLKPYNANKRATKHAVRDKRYKHRLDVAYKQADDADMLPLSERLAKYSFLNRYKGTIGEPKEITRQELIRFKNKLKRKLNIDFSDSDDTDSDENQQSGRNDVSRKQAMKNKNVIIIGTPKKRKLNNDLPKQMQNGTNNNNETVVEIPTKAATVTESEKTANVEDQTIFKQPNSLTVQIGSTTVNDTMLLDDDSSKTYLPESQIMNETTDASQTQQSETIHVRIASPSSDDFEF